MSHSDDLDWLARNVHQWPGGHQGWCFVTTHASGAKGVSTTNLMHPEATEITMSAWLARRAELQNKPSWKGAPEWAQWLVQDEDGVWYWHGKQPKPKGETVSGEKYWMSCGESMPDGRGELLGDWRSTLERRPDMHKNHKEIDTSEERVQKTPESVRNWHENGELPPVGVFVDVVGDVVYGDDEKNCEVVAHVENCAVIRMSFGLGCFEAKALSPHLTERGELIEIILSCNMSEGVLADAILAAGFKRCEV